jgi:hypothetical protein
MQGIYDAGNLQGTTGNIREFFLTLNQNPKDIKGLAFLSGEDQGICPGQEQGIHRKTGKSSGPASRQIFRS